MPTLRKDKHGYWFIDYRIDNKRFRKSYGKGKQAKKAAEIELSEINHKKNHDKLGIIKEIDLNDFLCLYLEYSENNKKFHSYKRDISIFKNFEKCFNDSVRNIKLTQITATYIEEYKNRRIKTVKKSTVNRELNTIKAALNKAVEWEYLSRNPSASVNKFKEPKALIRFFSRDEINKIFNNIEDSRLRAAIYILLWTGIRRDELIHLEWRDIDFKRDYLHVQPKADWNPKDYEARTIPLSGELKKFLIGLPHDDNKLILGDGEENFFCWPESLTRSFKRILKKIGINDAHIHTLRHTFASNLVMSGVDLPSVQKLLGHSDIRTTMRYAHLAPDHLKSAVKKLDSSFCPYSALEIKKGTKTGKLIPLDLSMNSNK